MPLQFTHKNRTEVPTAPGRINQDLVAVKNEMSKLASGMVLEIETGSEKAVRSTKTLVTKAASQLGTKWRHWSIGSKVFAEPMDVIKRRGRSPKAE